MDEIIEPLHYYLHPPPCPLASMLNENQRCIQWISFSNLSATRRGVSSGLYVRTFQQLVPPPCNIESGGVGGVASLLRSAWGSIILSIYCLASFRRPRYCSCPSTVWPASPDLVRDLYSGEATRISDVHACSSQSLCSASREIFPCIMHTVPPRRAACSKSFVLSYPELISSPTA